MKSPPRMERAWLTADVEARDDRQKRDATAFLEEMLDEASPLGDYRVGYDSPEFEIRTPLDVRSGTFRYEHAPREEHRLFIRYDVDADSFAEKVRTFAKEYGWHPEYFLRREQPEGPPVRVAAFEPLDDVQFQMTAVGNPKWWIPTLRTRDLEGMRRFYREIAGCEMFGGGDDAEFVAETPGLHLRVIEEPAPVSLHDSALVPTFLLAKGHELAELEEQLGDGMTEGGIAPMFPDRLHARRLETRDPEGTLVRFVELNAY